LPGAEAALQFAHLERAVIVVFEPIKHRNGSGLGFVQIDGAVMIRIDSLQEAGGTTRYGP
jgi:hypothetical protein